MKYRIEYQSKEQVYDVFENDVFVNCFETLKEARKYLSKKTNDFWEII